MRQFCDVLRSKHLLVFDLDGTLANTSPLHAKAFVEAFSGMDVLVNYDEIAGLTTEDAVRRLLGQNRLDISDADISKIVTKKRKIARDLIAGGGLQPLPGAKEFLKAASSRYGLALYSSGSATTVGLSLAHIGFSGLFDPVLTASDVRCPKPHPEGYLAVMTARRADPQHTLIFEDSAAGIEAGRRAGADVVQIDILCSYPVLTVDSVWQMDWLSASEVLERVP